MWPLGTSQPRDDGDSLIATFGEGRWRAEAIDRTDFVVEAPDLDSLRLAVHDASVARRRDEQRQDRPWKVAYLWVIEVAPPPKGWFASLRSMLSPGDRGPVLEVAADEAGYSARGEDGATVAAVTLRELAERVRQQYAPLGGADPPASITLFEVLEIPAEPTPSDVR